MKTFRTILIVLVIGALLVPAAFAQSSGRGRSRGPSTYDVRIQSNVGSAQLYVNGALQSGSLPQNLSLAAGSYTFQVRAAGYRDWSVTIDLQRDQNLVANLDPITYTLTVTSNVPARVLLSGEDYGNTTLQRTLTPGTYNVTVRANGYLDYNTTVTLDGNRTVNAQLQPANARVGVQVPGQITADVPGAAEMVTVFVDGRPMAGTTFEVGPGRHTIRVRSGGLQYEFVHDFAAGGSYTIVPSFSATIR